MTDPIAPASREPILVVDDEKNIRRTLRMVLEGEGWTRYATARARRGRLEVLAKEPVDAASPCS
jgi:two-component system nitrogen regulation response regulator NtrX